jgi:hypothetical protein
MKKGTKADSDMQRLFRILVVFVLYVIVLHIKNSKAQVSYTFSSMLTTQTYLELTNDTEVSSFSGNGLYTVNEVLGETFWFCNLPFSFGGLTTFSIGNNGYLRIDNDSSLIILDALNTGLSPLDSTSRISYVLEGLPGSLVFKLQYKNMSLNNGQAGNFANFQIWYFQDDGSFEYHYGPSSANNSGGYTTSNGPQVGMFYSSDMFTICYEKIWCTVNPLNPVLDMNANYVFSALPGVPADGTIYQFNPLFSVGMNSIQESVSFEIYPNPALDKLTLAADELTEGKVKIYNHEGKLIHSESFKQGKSTIDISRFQEGLFYFRLDSQQGSAAGKFFKAR